MSEVSANTLRSRKYRLEHPEFVERQRINARLWNARHKDRPNGNSKRTPEKVRAQSYVQSHPKLLMSTCEICNGNQNLVAHHPDYEYPTIIVTLCRSCHNFIHKGVI